jgi:glycosyltransferase involved in cell wall biosynthesis
VRHLPLGVAPPHPAPPPRAQARLKLGIEDDQLVIVAVAELRPEKRHDLLLKAIAELAHPRAVLLIAGDGPARAALESQASRLGMARAIRFLGRRADVPRVLAAADIGVLCSDREGTPLALMEYMQAGLAIAATRVGGIPRLLTHEREGLLTSPGAPDELTSAISRLCADSELRERLGLAARSRCDEELGIERYVRELERIYASLA